MLERNSKNSLFESTKKTKNTREREWTSWKK